MSSLLYLSNQKLNLLQDNKSITVPCQAIDQYKKNLVEIQQRKEWKSKGTGAQFMGMRAEQEDTDLNFIFPADAVITSDHKLIYTAYLQEGTSINLKSLDNLQETEGLILRKNDFIVHDMAYDETKRRLALSVNGQSGYERHICILPLDANRTQYLTEGDCVDSHPMFDPRDSDQLYYDTCGLAYGDHGVACGPKEICHLNMQTGDLETIISNVKFDFFKPKMDSLGNLYFLKRPYETSGRSSSPITSLKDILIAPFKIIRAIVGWLDFFTQRYTGESLKTTSGNNPAKTQQKSEEELFVEGNLIKAQQNLERNQKAGEKYPGMIPNTWELVMRSPSGDLSTLKKGVMSFALNDDSIFYSNGKYLVELLPDQTEKLLIEDKLISKIIC